MNRNWRVLALSLLAALSIAVAVPPARAATTAGLVLYADSEPGDRLGGGVTAKYTSGGESARAGDRSWVFGSALGSSDWWDFTFSAPTGQALTENVTYTFTSTQSTAASPGLKILHGSKGCSQVDGSFTVLQIDAYNFAAVFRHHCEGDAGTLYGYFGTPDATVDVVAVLQSASSLAFPTTAIGAISAEKTVTLTAGATLRAVITSASLAGASPAEFKITANTCTGALLPSGTSCTVKLRFAPTITGRLSATLLIDDDTYRGSRYVILTGTATTTASPVAWGAAAYVGPAYTWSTGSGLALTASGSTTFMHTTFATDRIGSTWAGRTGPYTGVMYVRGTSTTSWSPPLRLNSTSQHGDRATVASSGSGVYVAWVREASIYAASPTAARSVYLRRNTSHGASTAWKPAIALTSTSGRVDYPVVAAADPNVYVVWTNSDTGAVRLATSHDRGATWAQTTVGTTTHKSTEGFTGVPSVAAAGSTVVVAWVSANGLVVKSRVSANAGATWSTAITLAYNARSNPAVAARGNRVAVAWTADDGVRVRTMTGGVWGALRKIGTPTSRAYQWSAQPAVAFGGTGQVGVAWTACWAGCEATNVGARRTDALWAESKDAGVSWRTPQVVGDAASSSARRINDAVSIAWPIATRRIVLYNAWTPGTAYYRMMLRIGSGAS